MLRTCAARLTDQVYKHCPLPEARRPVYLYGFELFLSTASSIVSILILSLLFSVFPSTLLFLLLFCSLRSFVGGYHAKTYFRCFLLTHFVYFSVLGAARLLLLIPSEAFCFVLSAGLIVCSVIVMLILAPVKNANHPLSDSLYRKNRTIARALAPAVGVLSLLLLFLPEGQAWGVLSAVTLTAVAVMMIVPEIQKRRV